MEREDGGGIRNENERRCTVGGGGDLLEVGVRTSIKKMPNGFPIRIQIARNGGATGVKNGNVHRSFRGKGRRK